VEPPDERPPEHVPSSPPPPERAGALHPDPEGIGSRVSAVFTRAEQAADHILRMAQEEAKDIRRRAEAEMEVYQSAQREAADGEARRILEAARVEADGIRTQAVEAALAVEAAARARAQRIDEGVRLMVEQAEWSRQGMGEALARLDYFITRQPEEWVEAAPEASSETDSGLA
jgi:cell division septum initiation protein DivIVA